MKPSIDINRLNALADEYKKKTELERAIDNASQTERTTANHVLDEMYEKCEAAARKGARFTEIMEIPLNEVPSGHSIDYDINKQPQRLKGASAIVYQTVKDMFPEVEIYFRHDNTREYYYIRVYWRSHKEQS